MVQQKSLARFNSRVRKRSKLAVDSTQQRVNILQTHAVNQNNQISEEKGFDFVETSAFSPRALLVPPTSYLALERKQKCE